MDKEGAAFVKSIEGLLGLAVRTWGPWGTVALLGVLGAAFAGWHLYQEWRGRHEVNLALDEKERTIQRVAAQERLWRAYYLKQQGWSDETVDRFLLRNEFLDGPEAREALENGDASGPRGSRVAGEPKAQKDSGTSKDSRRRK